MAQTWDELTEAEKIADLRSDVKRIFTVLREMAEEQDRLTDQVSEAIKRLDSIETKKAS
jgi:hypothetical protein